MQRKSIPSQFFGMAVGGVEAGLLTTITGSYEMGYLLVKIAKGELQVTSSREILHPAVVYTSQPIKGLKKGRELGFKGSFFGVPKALFHPEMPTSKKYETFCEPDYALRCAK